MRETLEGRGVKMSNVYHNGLLLSKGLDFFCLFFYYLLLFVAELLLRCVYDSDSQPGCPES